MYKYSSVTNCFYPNELLTDYIQSNTLPNDLIDVSEGIFKKFTGKPPEGMVRVAGSDGLPSWGELPARTTEQLLYEAENIRNQKLDMVEKEILILSRSVKHSLASADDIDRLSRLEIYSVILSKVDLSNAPDVKWPENP